MNLERIVDTVASQADDILADVKTRAEARLALSHWLSLRQPALEEAAVTTVVDGVMSILEDEGFFANRLFGSFDAAAGADSEED